MHSRVYICLQDTRGNRVNGRGIETLSEPVRANECQSYIIGGYVTCTYSTYRYSKYMYECNMYMYMYVVASIAKK